MTTRFDIGIRDPAGRLIALVEAKGKTGTTPEWAAEFRQNLAYAGSLTVPHFAVITPDRLYLWSAAPGTDPGELPTFSADISTHLARFLSRSPETIGTLHGAAFELLVQMWLSAIAADSPSATWPPEMEQSGLLARLRAGQVLYEIAA